MQPAPQMSWNDLQTPAGPYMEQPGLPFCCPLPNCGEAFATEIDLQQHMAGCMHGRQNFMQ